MFVCTVDAQLGIDRHFFVADTPDGYDSLVARGLGFSYARSSYLAAKRRWGGFKHNLLLRPVCKHFSSVLIIFVDVDISFSGIV